MCTLLTPADAPSSWTDKAVGLYLSAFPPGERRTGVEWRRKLRRGSPFHLVFIAKANHFAGFISFWDFARFTYVEHFAIEETARGCGIGGATIDALRMQRPRLVLEVEPPADETACRRIGFYGRHGFHLSASPYLQPPYRRGGEWLPLRLMTTDPAFLQEAFAETKNTLYKHVYAAEAEK